MRLTRQSSYAIRTLVYCAVNDPQLSRVADIAKAHAISELFLFKLIKPLVENGLIRTVRGRHEGFGVAVVDLLFDVMEDKSVSSRHRVFKPELVPRASTLGFVPLFDDKGVKLPSTRQGYSSSGDESTIQFAIKGKLPKKGKIVAKLYDEPKTYEAPFKITDIDLLGRAKK